MLLVHSHGAPLTMHPPFAMVFLFASPLPPPPFFCFDFFPVQAQLTRLEQELQQLRETERLSNRSSAARTPAGPSTSSAGDAAATGDSLPSKPTKAYWVA